MEKFMQLYYDEKSEDETEGSTPDHPDQVSRKKHVWAGAAFVQRTEY